MIVFKFALLLNINQQLRGKTSMYELTEFSFNRCLTDKADKHRGIKPTGEINDNNTILNKLFTINNLLKKELYKV